MGSEAQLEVGGRTVRVTNLEKVLFPAAGFTKTHLIDYYIRMSRFILPHLEDRPVTLKRYPDGVGGEHFYEKDAPSFTPEWVSRTEVPRRGGGKPISYILINDLPTLVWSANLANIEMHAVLAKVPALNKPSALVFDLDPGEPAGFSEAAQVCCWLRELLQRLDLDACVKTSGSKGLHLHVPLNSEVGFDQTEQFTRLVAEHLARAHPNLVTAEMAKSLRTGKVFIDWSQNVDYKSTVCVYSLRAKRERPYVAMPLDWEWIGTARTSSEVERFLVEPDSALAMLQKSGDAFGDLLKLRQSLPERFEQCLRDVAKTSHASAQKKGRARKALAEPKTFGGIKNLPLAKPRFIEPMQCKLVAEVPEGSEWMYELKFDGYRAIAIKARGEVMLYSRNQKPFTHRYPGVVRALAGLPVEQLVLDGEIVALDSEGKPSFQALQRWNSPVESVYFYVFDLLNIDGHDLKALPLETRKELISRTIADAKDPVRLSVELKGSGKQVISAVRAQGLEGVIAKRRSSTYESGERSGNWIKFRTELEQEFVVGGYRSSSKDDFDALIVGYYQSSKLRYAGKIKAGFTPHSRRMLMERFKPLRSRRSAFSELPVGQGGRWGERMTEEDLRRSVWLKPEVVAEIQFVEWTAGGSLRHPRFKGIREDKRATDVIRELTSG